MDSDSIIKGAIASQASPWELDDVLKGDERVLLREYQQQQDALTRRFWEQLPQRLGAIRVEMLYDQMHPETQRSITLHAQYDPTTALSLAQREHVARLGLTPNN